MALTPKLNLPFALLPSAKSDELRGDSSQRENEVREVSERPGIFFGMFGFYLGTRRSHFTFVTLQMAFVDILLSLLYSMNYSLFIY